MGRSFLAGVQALTLTIAGAARQGGYTKEGGDNVGGKLYSENNVVALKGYCGVVDPHGIRAIWDAFQQTRELAQHRHNFRVGMMMWSKQTGMDIDKAHFFTEATIKDIVSLNFNPGEAVPTYLSTQREISILTCRPKSVHKVELIKDFEESRRTTAHTAQFNEVRRRQKTQPSAPPENYHELRLSVNTFCALIWTLFGEECNYYMGMLEIVETLDLQEVHIIREFFTLDVCRCITCRIRIGGCKVAGTQAAQPVQLDNPTMTTGGLALSGQRTHGGIPRLPYNLTGLDDKFNAMQRSCCRLGQITLASLMPQVTAPGES